MPIRRCLLLLLLAAPLSLSQVTHRQLAQGVDVIEAFSLGADSVAIQVGNSLIRTQIRGGGPRITGQLQLPSKTFLYDFTKTGAVAVGSNGVEERAFLRDPGKGPSSKALAGTAGPLFRGHPSTSPLRRPLIQDGSRIILPTLSGFDVLDFSADGVRTPQAIDVQSVSEQSLGWGLGYRMSSKVTLPALSHGDLNGDGRSDILLRSEGSLTAWFSGSGSQLWGRAPRKLDTEVVNFTQRVSSITHDIDGDSRDDHVLFDPGAGLVLFYASKGRTDAPCDRQPDQIIKVSGWVLNGAVFDIDGDGVDELFLLTIPKMNLLSQLRAFKKSLIAVQLDVRKITDDGLISRSPILRRRFELPVVISLTRNRRVCDYRALVSPIKTGDSWALLQPGNDGETVMQPFRGIEPDGEPQLFWPALAADAHFTRPFNPLQLEVDGAPSIIGVVLDAAGGRVAVRTLR